MKTGLVVLLGLACLSGCKGEPKPGPSAGTAQGEVLPGTASDAMLPLDTVQSQAPLAPKAEGSDGGDAKGTAKAGKLKAQTSDAAADAPEVKAEASPIAAGSPATN